MPEPHEDKRPLAERIAAEIRKLIMSGEWEPGKKVPTNEKLREQFETSNVTIQRALKILKDEKFLQGQTGVGVFVRGERAQTIQPAHYIAPSEPDQAYRWLTEATKRQQRGKYRMLEVGEVVPPIEVARALRLEEASTAMLRSRIGFLDDQPAELVHSYYPIELARGTRLADRRLIPGGSPALLQEMGYPTRSQDDAVAARPATTEEYEALEIPRDVPVLEIFRIVYSDDEKPIEVSVLTKPAHRFKMGYHIEL
ncbi:GntR family transcriptional regulator [Streptomyces malaysiensis]|uniref:GntR family transcriptional regulator n=1 Tax=Streptomyces malaysiensis subsp. samsunensis TaxID=459658 RepID=A0A9X2LYY2_STRMQ|nr:GntR family transcriptional regulator [Streptomyces samsunensis]MCQ8831805.1 GntR family transcriptional regulator [Streptomyces samsunensis]